MKFVKLWILFYFIMFFGFSSYAEFDESFNYHGELFNAYNGLPASEANDIIQTSDGHIWIGSYNTLIRYDGREFTDYSDNQMLTSILCMLEDAQGRLWVGTNNNGVAVYEDHMFHFLDIGDDAPSYSVRSLTETSEGIILVGTSLGMYAVHSDFSIEILEEPELEYAFVTRLISYGDNQTLAITKVGDLFFLEGTEVVAYLPIDQWEYDVALSAIAMEEEEERYFLLGTTGDYLLEMRPSGDGFSFREISTDGLKYINKLFVDSKSRIWIGSDSGAGFLQNGQLVSLDYLELDNTIVDIEEDMEGNFWLASTKEGVLKLSDSPFKNASITLENTLQVNGVAVYDGYIYMVSVEGITILDEVTHREIENELTQRYKGEYFRCVELDALGNLWFSSYGDDVLIKYTPRTGEIVTIGEEEGLDYPRVRSTMTASDGRIWVATGNGVYVLEHDVVVDHYGRDDGILNLEILSISEDQAGRVFIGTDGAGAYVVQDGEIIDHINRSKGLLSDIILRTENDPFLEGTWLVTGNSIYYYNMDEGRLQLIENFPNSNNFDLLFYEDTMIVLSSNGVYFASHEVMLADEKEFSYIYKNHLDGLFSFPVANSFSRVDDGILYLCGYQNLTSYDLKNFNNTKDYQPIITIPSIQVGDTLIYAEDSGKYYLPYTANYLEIELFIPTYSLQDYIVSYQMLDYDEAPLEYAYQDLPAISYTNLPGGTYEFFVELRDNRSGELINTGTFVLTKEYYFMENPVVHTLFFYLLVVFLFLLSNYIIKRKTKKTKEEQQKVQQMFDNVVELLAQVVDFKDQYTNGHSQRVAKYTKALAKALQFSPSEVESAYGIALLHDVGKIAIPDDVLNKPGRLTEEEFAIMKTHAEKGAQLLEKIDIWPDLLVGAKYHHERYDGEGYGSGLKGEEIPQIARMICIADAFDAMYSSRVYRKKLEFEYVIEELQRCSGTQFDPEMVEVFIKLLQDGTLQKELDEVREQDESST
ncbi:MAG: two-component regulator propeller domain-containing protein [Eubacteriales bacterium]